MKTETGVQAVKTGWKCIDDRTLTADMLRLDKEAQEAFINALTPAELDALPFDWGFWARDDQLPPRDWITGEKYIWCLRCGRGWGKTRTAGQAIIEAVRTGKYKHLSLCGATAEEVRDIMINGESGLARYCPPDLGMVYKPSIKAVQAFLTKNKTLLFNIYKQTMVDGKHYVWVRLERTATGKSEIRIKQIPLELVVEDDCIKDLAGGYTRFVTETVEKWKANGMERKATIRITLEEGKETITIDGELPPQYQSKQMVNHTAFSFVPVFCLYNNKQTFLKDGIPEIAPAVPFIRRYDATLRKLGRHIDNILEPRLLVKVKNVAQFLKYSFGLTDEKIGHIAEGKEAVDMTQFKAAIMDGEDAASDIRYVGQANNVESAVSLLKLLHWIIVELTMPEYLYGTAMQSTNASVAEQSPVWAKKVEGRQGEYNEFYYWLTDVFKAARIALAGRDEFAGDGGADNPIVRWQELTAKDDVAMMNALATFVGAMDKAMTMGLVSPKSAFNTLKTFMAIPADYETEKDAATEWLKLKIRLEALQDRIRSGDIEAEAAIEDLFKSA